ncbi:MAG: GAF domain-containing sensor histidine kinase [Rhodospirillaceae bacterium]|jgi:two-component system, sensor histidine kinase|nr:GAF domain-containing sensor histidine kinase [Rhodospirillaceae bacterium]MBT5567319.1 GAF domain-containing sensor histidine kinase [Rhodospirillaceae bacterium]MBT6091172.1 GAF domain-containing sensor histidine kinase [Rhodospirillaceae bacterium]
MTVPAALPENESERLARLRAYDILDTSPEEAFDRITRVAAHLFGTPIALVSLVDENRQWFKSRQGLDATETPRDVAFCAHAILEDELFVVPNATLDDRFKNNPLVTGGPEIQFYAGAPLRTKDGLGLGTLCIIDTKPHDLTDLQLEQLQDLADLAMDALSLRRAGRHAIEEAHQTAKLGSLQDSFIDSINHELRTPLTSLAGALGLLRNGVVADLDEETQSVFEVADRNTHTLMKLIVDLLDMSNIEKGELVLNFESFDLLELANTVADEANSDKKMKTARVSIDDTAVSQVVYADPMLIGKAVSALVKNALRFSPNDTPVTLHLRAGIESVIVEVADLGIGISLQDRSRVFKKFFKLDESGNINGAGLGLSIAKRLIEAHGGEIGIQANTPRGTRVIFEIPRTLMTQDQQSAPSTS